MVSIATRKGQGSEGNYIHELLIKHNERIILYVRLPDDTTESLFRALLRSKYPREPGEPVYEIEEVIRCVSNLLDTYDSADKDKKLLIIKLAESVDRFLDLGDHKDLREICHKEYRHLKSFLYQFDVQEVIEAGQRLIEVRFFVSKRLVFLWHLPLRAAKRARKNLVVSQEGFHYGLIEAWSSSLPEEVQSLQSVIAHFPQFAEGLEPRDSSMMQCYKEFAKALVEFCEHTHGAFLQFYSLIPRICAFVATVEEEEEEEHYLERIVLYERRSEERRRLFEKIVAEVDVSRPSGRSKQKRVINRISTHYLRVYDLESAADFFDKLCHKGLVYDCATFIYRHVIPVSGTLFLLLCISCLFRPKQDMTSRFLIVSTLALAYLLVLGFLIVTLVKGEIHYMRLVFPRLLGAIVVGLCILAPQDLPWKWGLLDWRSLTLVCAITYLSAFAYVYLEVETALRPAGAKLGTILRSSLKVYLIGLLEAVLVATVVTSLLSSAMRDVNSLYAGRAFFFGPFALYPSLTIVWAGIALFVAGFAQLLWQSKRITESI